MKPHQKKQLASPCILRLHAPNLFVSHFPAQPQLSASPCVGPRLKSTTTNLDPKVNELSQFRLPRLMERYTRKDSSGRIHYQYQHTRNTQKGFSNVIFVLKKYSRRPSDTHSNVSTRKPVSQCPCTLANRTANIKNGRYSKPTGMHLMMIMNRLQNMFSKENLDLA